MLCQQALRLESRNHPDRIDTLERLAGHLEESSYDNPLGISARKSIQL